MTDHADLIELCELGWVSEAKWRNRDSAEAQIQLGKAYALLNAGCDFRIDESMGDEHTVWVRIAYRGFGSFDWGGDKDEELFYLPTKARLQEAVGRDWY